MKPSRVNATGTGPFVTTSNRNCGARPVKLARRCSGLTTTSSLADFSPAAEAALRLRALPCITSPSHFESVWCGKRVQHLLRERRTAGGIFPSRLDPRGSLVGGDRDRFKWALDDVAVYRTEGLAKDDAARATGFQYETLVRQFAKELVGPSAAEPAAGVTRGCQSWTHCRTRSAAEKSRFPETAPECHLR